MKNIEVYTTDAYKIQHIAEHNDTTIAEIFELLMEYAEQMIDDNGLS